MRLLLLNYEYPPLGGGAGNAMQHIVSELAGMGRFEIDIVCSSPGPFQLETPFHGVTLHRIDIGKRGSMHYQTQLDLLRFAWKARQYCQRLIKVKSYAGCLAFFGVPCGVVARSLRLPYLVSLRGSDVPGYNPRFALLDRLVFARLSRRVWQDAAGVVANSAGLRELALRTSPGQAIGVIPNGVDTQHFSPAPQFPQGEVVLLCVARLIPRKGIADLLEALALLPQHVRLLLVGDGKEAEALRVEAARLGIDSRVRFLGAVPHEELPDIYRSASIFVLPSVNEGMSNTVLEAVASGLPVVLTDTGGTRELLREGVNGWMIPVHAPAAIADAVMRYVREPALLPVHGAESRRVAERFSWRAAAEAYAALFDQHFGGARGG